MGAHESIWTASLAVLASALGPHAEARAATDPTRGAATERDPARIARALADARGGGPAAARKALADFAAASAPERRLRARRRRRGPRDRGAARGGGRTGSGRGRAARADRRRSRARIARRARGGRAPRAPARAARRRSARARDARAARRRVGRGAAR